MKTTWMLAVASLLLVVTPAQAERLYKWVDETGKVTYQDRPPPAAGGRVEEKEFRDRSYNRGEDGEGTRARPPVTLYAVPKCEACDMARNYLKKRGVPFSERNANDAAAQKELKERAGDVTVPTLLVGSKVMRGYMESILEGELDQAGYPKANPSPQADEAP